MDAFKRNLIVAEECAPPNYLPHAIRPSPKRKYDSSFDRSDRSDRSDNRFGRFENITTWDLLSSPAKRSKAAKEFLNSQSIDSLSGKLNTDKVVKISQFKQSSVQDNRRRLLPVYESNCLPELEAYLIMNPQRRGRRPGYGSVISGNTVAKQELEWEVERKFRMANEYKPFPRESNDSQERFDSVSRSQEADAILQTKANTVSKNMENTVSKDIENTVIVNMDNTVGKDMENTVIMNMGNTVIMNMENTVIINMDNTVDKDIDGTEKDSAALVPKTSFDDILSRQEHKETHKTEPYYKQLLNRVVNYFSASETRRQQELEFLKKKEEAVQFNVKLVLEKQNARREEKEALQKEVEDPALKPLSAEAQAKVNAALMDGNGSDVLVNHKGTNIIITREMMQCLLPGEWLNDEVINVYLSLLKERELREPKKHPKCHIFNTFFYNKLFSDRAKYDYKGVRRWTTHKKLGYNLKDCAKIIVPVHQAIHWTVAVINIQEKRLEFYDSLRGSDRDCLENLARYIMDDIKDKSGEEWDVSSWPRSCPKDIPLQLNGCDCGVFMVKYADYASRDSSFSFDQSHMEYFRRRTVWELLQQETGD